MLREEGILARDINRPSVNIDSEQPVLDLDRIGPQPHGRVGQAARAAQVKTKAVPRTGHGRPFEPAPAQGAALVGTGVFDRSYVREESHMN